MPGEPFDMRQTPGASWDDMPEPVPAVNLEAVAEAARKYGTPLAPAPVRTPKEWGALFAGCIRERIAADPFTDRLALSIERIVTQALAAEREAFAAYCERSAAEAAAKPREGLTEWNHGWLDGWADGARSLAAHARGAP